MKVVISLCDYSGNWPRPWNEDGYTVLCYDLKHGDDVRHLTPHAVAYDVWNAARPRSDVPSVIVCALAAPPCTDFTVSGAQYWKAKDADGRTAASLEVLDSCVSLCRFLSPDCWALENPVGRIPSLRPSVGKPIYYFNPCDYAGWIEGDADRYTKKTGMWGNHVKPSPKPLEPIRVCAQGSWLMKLGGKSERTKELRSMTPMGFARAFFAANKH